MKAVVRHAKRRVLVVDDLVAYAKTLAAILEDQGYTTVQAYSGEEAVQTAITFKPDLLLSDIDMGAMNGVEAAIEVLTHLPGCKVLFITGHQDYQELLGNAEALGHSFNVLEKPVFPDDVLEAISQVFVGSTDQSRTEVPHKKPEGETSLADNTPFRQKRWRS